MQEVREELTRRIETLKNQIERNETAAQGLTAEIAELDGHTAKNRTLVAQYEQVIASLPAT